MTETPDFLLVEFDPANPDHAAFVYGTARDSLTRQWPWSDLSESRLMAKLKRELASPGTVTRLITLVDDPTVFAGWVAVRPSANTVVFAFVKYPTRRWGVCTSACLQLGIEFAERQVGVCFWTRAAQRITTQHHGYQLFHQVTEQ